MFCFEKLTCNYAQAELSLAHNDQERGITMKKKLTRRESDAAVYAIRDVLQKIHDAEVATDSDIETLARRLAYIEDHHFFLCLESLLWAERHHKRIYTWRYAKWMARQAECETPAELLGWVY